MSSWDPYLDLSSGLLVNRLGITDAAELAAVEASVTAIGQAELERFPIPGSLDLAYLQAVHRHLLGSLYPWAGELRTIALGKRGTIFCPPDQLEHRATQVFRGLALRDSLRGLRRGPFLDALTEFVDPVNRLHPFRDGNGRATRVLVSELARRAGHRLSLSTLPEP